MSGEWDQCVGHLIRAARARVVAAAPSNSVGAAPSNSVGAVIAARAEAVKTREGLAQWAEKAGPEACAESAARFFAANPELRPRDAEEAELIREAREASALAAVSTVIPGRTREVIRNGRTVREPLREWHDAR